MFQLLRKFSIIDRVFVSLVVLACLLAAVGGGAAWRLQQQSDQASELARQARAVEGAAAKKLAESAAALAAHSAGSVTTLGLAALVCTLLGVVAAVILRASIKHPVEALVASGSKLAAGDNYTTLELKIAYHKAISEKTGKVRAEGRVLSFGRRVAFSEGKLLDKDGRLLASASSTLLVIPRQGITQELDDETRNSGS